MYYDCWQKDPTNKPESELILLISQQVQNIHQLKLSDINYIHAVKTEKKQTENAQMQQ